MQVYEHISAAEERCLNNELSFIFKKRQNELYGEGFYFFFCFSFGEEISAGTMKS